MDFLGYVLQGFSVGLGVGIANYFSDKHIKNQLEQLDAKIKGVFNGKRQT